MSVKVCPKCTSWRVMGSESGSLLDRFLQTLRLQRYFCGDCGWQGIGLLKEVRPAGGPPWYLTVWRYFLVVAVFTGTAYGLSVLYAQFADTRTPKAVEKVSAGAGSAVSTSLPTLAETQARAEQTPQKIKVVGNRDSKRYHLPGMKYYDKVDAHHRVEFASEEEAVAAGFRRAPR